MENELVLHVSFLNPPLSSRMIDPVEFGSTSSVPRDVFTSVWGLWPKSSLVIDGWLCLYMTHQNTVTSLPLIVFKDDSPVTWQYSIDIFYTAVKKKDEYNFPSELWHYFPQPYNDILGLNLYVWKWIEITYFNIIYITAEFCKIHWSLAWLMSKWMKYDNHKM